MSNPKSYKFSSFQELVDVVPADRIRDCMEELAVCFQAAKLGAEIAMREAGIRWQEGARIVIIEEEQEWIDDGKGTLDVTMETSDGAEIGTLKYRKADE